MHYLLWLPMGLLIIFGSCFTVAQLNTSDMLPETVSGTPAPSSTTSNFTCSTDFYINPTTKLCKPICGQWKPTQMQLKVRPFLFLKRWLAQTTGVVIILASALKYRHM